MGAFSGSPRFLACSAGKSRGRELWGANGGCAEVGFWWGLSLMRGRKFPLNERSSLEDWAQPELFARSTRRTRRIDATKTPFPSLRELRVLRAKPVHRGSRS